MRRCGGFAPQMAAARARRTTVRLGVRRVEALLGLRRVEPLPGLRRVAVRPAPRRAAPIPISTRAWPRWSRSLPVRGEAREAAAREARRATEQTIRDVRAMAGDRPSDEDLGYYKTEDSFSRILDDAAAELGERFTEARDSPAGHRVSDLIDELTSKLTGEHHKPVAYK